VLARLAQLFQDYLPTAKFVRTRIGMRSLVNGGQREKTSADGVNYSSRLMKLTALFWIAVN